MKTQLLLWLITLIFILAFNKEGAEAFTPAIGNFNNCTKKEALGKGGILNAQTAVTTSKKSTFIRQTNRSIIRRSSSAPDSISRLLRLKLIIDSLNYDDIIIGFNAGASLTYNSNEDAEYWRGLNSPEGLSSFSSDGIQLSQNYLPLPRQKPLIIKLNVEAKYSGAFTLQRTELDSLPPIYEVWLMDNYKKDSLDIRNNTLYNFSIDKKDTATFGKNRFQVVIRQNPALVVHLLGFSAIKAAAAGAQITWKTENEQNYTNFTVERSSDNGLTYTNLTAFISSQQGTYSYLDKSLLVSAYQYRLKVDDLNGVASYSNVVTLSYGGSNAPAAVNSMVVYPNPAGSIINIAINPNSTTPSNASNFQVNSPFNLNAINNVQSYGIKITNSTGSIIRAATVTQTDWQNNIDNLKPGAYIIQVINNSNNSIVGKSTFIKL